MSITNCYTKCAFVVKYYTYKKINISAKIPAEKKTRNIHIPTEKRTILHSAQTKLHIP